MAAATRASSTPYLVVDPASGRIDVANPAAGRLFGCVPEALAGRETETLFAEPLPSPTFRERCAALSLEPDGPPFPARARVDGHALPVEMTLRAADGPAAGRVVIALRELRDRRDVEDTLRRLAARHGLIARFGQRVLALGSTDEVLQEAVEVLRAGLGDHRSRLLVLPSGAAAPVPVASHGWGGDWLDDGQVLHAMLGGSAATLEAPAGPLVVVDAQLQHWLALTPGLASQGVRSVVEVPLCGAGETHGLIGVYSCEPMRFDAADVDFLQSVAATLSAAIERQRTEQRLSHMAQFDALTGLPNRSLALDRLARSIVEASRDGRPVGVLFVDLDRFQFVNDTLGHAVGDALLQHVAERLSACVRPGDTVGRLGADEFAVMLAHMGRAEDAGLVAGKIVDALSPAYVIGTHTVFVSVSIGIAVHPSDGDEPAVLLQHAETALHRAKDAGGNGYAFYLPQMNERAMARMRIEADLRNALERREFVLHYQPKVDLRSGRIAGLEALLRWNRPDRGLVPPDAFIPVLEETGLIVGVGAWVIDHVLEQIGRWQRIGIAVRPVAVNVSARQFRQGDLDEIVGRLLQQHGTDPGLLELELTESTLMSDSEAAVRMLRNMRARGLRISVDDFGTGYSSLSYLKRFPLDALKIDRSFIRDVPADADDATIAKAVIDLAHALKLRVVAEGVETQAQVEFLRGHGCDEMQGYFFARPMTVEQITTGLRNELRLVTEPGPQSPV